MESGVDPYFQEDDGSQFLEIFSDAWNHWLDEAFGERGSHHAQWREILDVVDLKEIREFALALCDDQVVLCDLYTQLDSESPSSALASWLARNHEQIVQLRQEYAPAKLRKIERLLEVAGRVFDLMIRDGWRGVGSLENEEKELLSSAIGQAPKGWTPDDFQEARRIVQNAQRLLKVDAALLRKIISLLEPFVEYVCRLYCRNRWIFSLMPGKSMAIYMNSI